MSSTSILSNPTGPSELLTMFAIEEAAITVNNKKAINGKAFRYFLQRQSLITLLFISTETKYRVFFYNTTQNLEIKKTNIKNILNLIYSY